MPSRIYNRYYEFIRVVIRFCGHSGKIGALHFCRITGHDIAKLYFYFFDKNKTLKRNG
jgi:hypothetical protein